MTSYFGRNLAKILLDLICPLFLVNTKPHSKIILDLSNKTLFYYAFFYSKDSQSEYYTQCIKLVIQNFMNASPRSPLLYVTIFFNLKRGHRGRDCLVVGFRTTYAINAHHRKCCDFESHSGELYFLLHNDFI